MINFIIKQINRIGLTKLKNYIDDYLPIKRQVNHIKIQENNIHKLGTIDDVSYRLLVIYDIYLMIS